eukprot:jgi/Tetstr1/453421/TSEL_040403.t1
MTSITRLNEAALRTRTSFRPVTESEWVRFWGLMIAARQFNQKGHHLWGDHTESDGIREASNFQKYMPYWRFELIHALVKYSKATPGAGPNTTEMFNQMVADFNKNKEMMLYIARSPRVENHNQSRQHDLKLQELWHTQDCWFRLHTTMAGIHVTDCWKLLAKYHLPRHHPLANTSVVNFADILCKALIYNGLQGQVESTRRSERVALADITDAPPPLPRCIMHPGKRPGNDNATKQARCTMCRVDDDTVGWASFKCPDCDIPLCIPSKRRKGVACWTRHRRMAAQGLAVYGVNRRKD